MGIKRLGPASEQGRAFWPVLLIMLSAVLVPTAFVLWFMNAAMDNERLAVRQRLSDVYGGQLAVVQKCVEEVWTDRIERLDGASDLSAAELFESLIVAGVAEAVVVYDESGRIAYPTASAGLLRAGLVDRSWGWIADLERDGYYSEAIDAYQAIAEKEGNVDRRAQALQGKARCLLRLGRRDEAVEILGRVLCGDEFVAARDRWGRLISADAMMHALRLTEGNRGERWETLRAELLARLNDYGEPLMDSAQRRFLMAELEELTGVAVAMLEAERLAGAYLDGTPDFPVGEGLRPAGVEGIWALASSNGLVVGLYGEEEVERLVARCEAAADSLVGAELVVHHGREFGDGREAFVSVAVGPVTPDWYVAVYLDDPDLFAAEAKRRNAVYLWTGGAGILLIVAFSLVVAGWIGRQIRLTRLKNDLIATVSHELKTPLASMRVLVDTMREGRCTGADQTQEYLELISKENERLTRLINSFLTFSRMERNKQAFEFKPLSIAAVVEEAAESMTGRFEHSDSTLDLEIEPGLPDAWADRDAILTVVINLLDNACKYGNGDTRVAVSAFARESDVYLRVSDNGVGMSRRTAKRVFDKFYQADQSLSRKAGGCGLGLSLVRFIVDAHGGDIEVDSQIGVGSVFTVRLVAVDKPGPVGHAG